jgi:hypothetical protein
MRIQCTANKYLGVLRRTCYELKDTHVRRILYLSLVKLTVSYGSQVWSPQTTNLTLWILGIKHGDLPYVECLKKLELLPLAYDREIRDLLFYYKCRNGLIDLDMGKFTAFVCSRTRRGSSSYLQIPYRKTSTFKMSYFNRIVNLWNFILNVAPPDTFLTISSFRTFLHKIYKDLLSKIFDPDLTCTYSLYRTCSCHSLYIFNLT